MSQRLAKSDQHGPKDLEQVYKEIYEQAVRMVDRRFPNVEGYDAEDFVQEMFLKLVTKNVSFEKVEDPIKYAMTSVKHTVFDQMKRKSRLTAENSFSIDQPVSDDKMCKEIPDPRRSPEMNAQIKEENEIYECVLKAASSDFTESEKTLLDLLRGGLSNYDIADRLGTNVEDIRKQTNALRSRLRYRLRQRMKRNNRVQH
jgi:RNA polymerase sigma factor (sigma-70 family)